MSNVVPAADRLDTLSKDFPEYTLGFEAAAWAATYLRHPDGDNAGKRWTFTPRQFLFLCQWYAVDENGDWLYGHGVRRLGKGSGKSPHAAVMALIELLAPVRFSHFDPTVPGGCIGKRVAMPWVQIGASSAEQTKNTMVLVRAMVNPAVAPRLNEDYSLDIGKEKIYSEPGGTLEIISSSARSAEGNRCTFAILDETEHFTPASGGVDLFDTVIANLDKTGSRAIETCNAWIPDADTVAERTFRSWQKQEEGKEREVKRKILMDIVQAPFDTDISDEDSLRRGLEFVYDDCPWSLKHLDAVISRIYTSSTPLEASKRKFLNWPTSAEDAWVEGRKWALLADPERVVEPGEDIVAFFDGSRSRDDTALVGCCVRDGHVFMIGHWRGSKPGERSRQIDPKLVDAAVDRMFSSYNVRAFFCDVREYDGYVKTLWPERYAEKVDVWATPRGEIPEPFAWDMRTKLKDFTMACELTEAEIEEQAFTHDGSLALADHMTNARRYENRYGISVMKESKNSPNKIDLAVCAIGARHALRVLKENAGSPMSYEAFFI